MDIKTINYINQLNTYKSIINQLQLYEKCVVVTKRVKIEHI